MKLNKMKKLLIGLGSTAAIATPIVAVVSCAGSTAVDPVGTGDNSAEVRSEGLNYSIMGDKAAVLPGGYGSVISHVGTTPNSMAGAWGDARFYARANAKDIKAIGVVKNRISNDGIEARPKLDAGDQHASQQLFVKLIKEANQQKTTAGEVKNKDAFEALTNKSLLMFLNGKLKTVFEVYSHADYVPTKASSEISYLKNTEGQQSIATKVALDSGNAPKPKATGVLFKKADQTEQSDWSDFVTNDTIKVVFIPSNDPNGVRASSKQIETFLNSKNISAAIDVSSDYDTAATQLESKQFDLAFLPIDTWVNKAPKSNLIIQAARPTQVATMQLSGDKIVNPSEQTTMNDEKTAVNLANKYGQLFLSEVTNDALANADLTDAQKAFKTAMAKADSIESKIQAYANDPKNKDELLSGSYESWIYMNIHGGSYDKMSKKLNADGNDWTIPYSDVKNIEYHGTSMTSSSSWVYPQLWINKHITK